MHKPRRRGKSQATKPSQGDRRAFHHKKFIHMVAKRLVGYHCMENVTAVHLIKAQEKIVQGFVAKGWTPDCVRECAEALVAKL